MTALWVFSDHDPWDDDPVLQFINGEESIMTTTKTTARKSTTTAKKAPTTTAKKGTTMTNETPAKKLTKEEKKAAALAARQAEIDALKAKYDEPAFTEPVNVRSILRAIYLTDTTGKEKKPAAIYISDLDKEFLCWYSNERGWTNNGFMTANQVEECHGTIPEGVEGVILHGPTGFPAPYYNVDDIEWENGEPVFDDESEAMYKARSKSRRQHNAEVKAAREQRQLQKEIADGTRTLKAVIDGIEFIGTLDELKALKAAMTA